MAAAAGGLLDEGHHVELKREVPAGAAGNKELGRDLASFAIDGGVLLVGISDDASAAGAVVDVDLPGLAERVDQVARSRVTPPLSVLCRTLPNPDQPDRGVLVVEIPPSPDAPHMAEDRYWGRGDRTKHPLADAQVRELLNARGRARTDAGGLLDRFVAGVRDRVADNPDSNLFILARPATPRPDAVADLLYDPGAAARLMNFAENIGIRVEQSVGRVEPGLRSPLNYHRLTDRVELRTDAGPPTDPSWPALLHLHLGADGTVGLISGAGTYRSGLDPAERHLISCADLIRLVRNVVAVAAAVADHAGYNGSWSLGVALDRPQGAIDVTRATGRGARYAPAYQDDGYQRATTATTAELVDTPALVTDRLLRPLLRALDTVEKHQALLTAPPQSTSTSNESRHHPGQPR